MLDDMRPRLGLACCGLAAAVSVCLSFLPAEAIAGDEPAKTILWVGNSHTRWYGGGSVGPSSVEPGMAQVVGELAVLSGHASPVNIWSATNPANGATVFSVVDGEFLINHARNRDVFVDAVEPGGWDHVVLQGNSVENVPELGNPGRFQTAVAAFENSFRAHSPGVEFIMYQTWARGYGHSNYAPQGGPVADPRAYHDATRAGYVQAVEQVIATAGDPRAARRAAVGDAWAASDWDPTLYIADRNHSSTRGSILAGLVLYGTIYEDRTVLDLDIDFGDPRSAFEQRLVSAGIDADQWLYLGGLAETALVPSPGGGVVGVIIACCAIRRRQ